MPDFISRIIKAVNPNVGGEAPLNRYEGFKSDGSIVVRDRRGTVKSEIPVVEEKAFGADPLAIYRPSGAKAVDAAKAMASFTGWTLWRSRSTL